MPNETQDSTAEVSKGGLTPNEKSWLGMHLGKSLFVNEKGVALMKTPPGIDVALVLGEEYKKQVQALRSELMKLDPKAEETKGQYSLVKKQLDELTAPLEQMGMPLESIAEKAAEFDEKNKKREAKLEEIRNLIAIQKEQFRESTDVVYEVERSILPGTKKIPAKVLEGQFVGLQRAKSDSDEYVEMSLDHYEGRVKPLAPEVQKMLDLVIQQLELISNQLLGDEEIDITPNEVMAELWTPLVREGIISSDQCPAEYSRIMTLFKGANDLYLKRCEEKAREPEDKTLSAQNMLADLDSALDIGADVAAIVLTFVGGESAQEILKLVRKCVHGGLQGTKKALALEFDKAGSLVAGALEEAIKLATGNDQLASLVKGAFTGALNGALMSKSLANRQWEEAFGFLCDGMEGAFVVMDKGGEGKAGEIGNHVVTGMKGAKSLAKIGYLLSEDPVNTGEVLREMGTLANTGISYGIKTYVLDKDKEKEKEGPQKILDNEKATEEEKKEAKAELDEIDKKYKDLTTKVEETIKTGTNDGEKGGLSEDMATALGFSKDEVLDEEAIMADVLRRTEAKAMKDFAKKEETFERRIAIAYGVGAGASDDQLQMIEDLYDIDVLIGEIEEARAKIQLLKTILDAVSGVLTLLVPQLGGPLKARTFAFDCASAIRRSQELIKFQALVGDARKSTSPQVHTLIAQVSELSHQLTNDVLDASFHLVEACVTTAAGACELSGIAAPAGEALKIAEMGIEALEKAKNLLYKKFKEKLVTNAWKQYRKAIDNPKDRKAIMKSFRSNPTLAKYGIAYGALEMGDPIAKEALRQCGLNDMTLANENSNAEKVVRYLEVKYPDDIQVVGVLSRFAPDSGDPLSMQIWVKNKELAEGAGWQKEATTEIDVNLIKAKKTGDGIDGLKKTIGTATETELTEHWQNLQNNLDDLAKAFKSYQPKTTSGQPFQRFLQYLSELSDAATERSQGLAEEIAMRKQAIKREGEGKLKLKENGEKMVMKIGETTKALNGFMPTDDDTTGEEAAAKIGEFFKSGQGKDLLNEVRSYSKVSVVLSQHVDFFVKAVNLSVSKTEKDPVQVAGHIKETIQRLELCVSQVQSTLSA